ncbi:MAG: hypothetical protein ACXIU7_07850 [Roseinatronobacter sp.]
MRQEYFLTMPLRDLFRGMRQVGRRADALGAVPAALRAGFKRIEARLVPSLKDALHAHDLRAAAAWVATGTGSDGTGSDGTGSEAAFLKVLAHLWDKSVAEQDRAVVIYSELLAQRRLHSLPAGSTGPARAAAILRALRDSHVFGPAPGLPLPLDAADQDHLDSLLAAVLIWLLAERETTLAAESWLFDLAVVLVGSDLPRLQASLADPAQLADLLQDLAGQL